MSPSSNGSSADLTGRVALVTGGSRGIGATIASRLRDAGAAVLVCARSESTMDGVTFTQADVREPDQAARVVSEAVERFGRLDLVVNNAGGGPVVPAADLPAKLATAVVRLNLLAPLFVAQAANAVMQGQPEGGLILNIGSSAATRPAPGTAVYAASKAGLVTLTQALAIEWAPRVRVNCVSVGMALTEDNAIHYGDEAAQAALAATVPLGRLATPDDVADACLLLASPLAGYLTGATLTVDGGGQLSAYASGRRSP